MELGRFAGVGHVLKIVNHKRIMSPTPTMTNTNKYLLVPFSPVFSLLVFCSVFFSSYALMEQNIIKVVE